jgi:hypothetical protein
MNMETGLFEIQSGGLTQPRRVRAASREIVYALFGRADARSCRLDPASHGGASQSEEVPGTISSVKTGVNNTAELALCFLRLANLPNYALDRLSPPVCA